MDLYEALKAGSSAEQLLKAFNEDLEKANAKLKEEQEVAEKNLLNKSRKELAKVMTEYFKLLFKDTFKDDGNSFSEKDIEKILFDFEKNINKVFEGTEYIKNFIELTKANKDENDDEAIIRAFLSTL